MMRHAEILRDAAELAIRFLDRVDDRHVGGRIDRAALVEALGGPLPEGGMDPASVIDSLAQAADAGLVASPGPRYFGFVTGGSLPVTVAADWLTSAWDQNGAMYAMSPAVAVLEDIVAGWIVETLGLPSTVERRLRQRRAHGERHRPGGGPARGAATGRMGRRGAGPAARAAR